MSKLRTEEEKAEKREYQRLWRLRNAEKTVSRRRENYLKRRDRNIKLMKEYNKRTNYASQKTPEARKIKNIRRKTIDKFPLKNQICAMCCDIATERHHTTMPIEFDKFIFVCDRCHLNIHNEERKKRQSHISKEVLKKPSG